MSRNPLSPQVPRLRLVEYRLDYLLGLMAVEAVATGETGITYRVSWGIETARTPKPPRTVQAETRPNDNLLGPRLTFGTDSDYPHSIFAEGPFNADYATRRASVYNQASGLMSVLLKHQSRQLLALQITAGRICHDQEGTHRNHSR